MSCHRRISKNEQEKSSAPEDEVEKMSHPVSVETAESQTDFYQILGVDEEASYDEIKKKWLKLSLIYHPDKCNGDNEMFRKINLAYKVLSNPENRKKYNDSLAKTFDQLRDEKRDTDYHVNQEYVTDESKFARDKFLDDFERSRGNFKELNEISPMADTRLEPVKEVDLKTLLADRDADLVSFRDNQKSELTDFDPKKNREEFNYIFSSFRHSTRRDLEESQMSELMEEDKDYAPVDFNYMPGDESHRIINDLTNAFKDQFIQQGEIPVVTSQEKPDVSELEKRMADYRLEGKAIDKVLKETGNYKVEFDEEISGKTIAASELVGSPTEAVSCEDYCCHDDSD